MHIESRQALSPLHIALTVVLGVVAIAAAVLVLSPMGPRGVEWLAPAHYGALTPGMNLIRDGALYYPEAGRDGVQAIYRLPVTSSAPQLVAKLPAGLAVLGPMWTSGSDILFRAGSPVTPNVVPNRSAMRPDPRLAALESPGMRFEGFFRAGGRSSRAQAPARVPVNPPAETKQAATRLMAVPCSGGTVRELAEVAGEEVCLVGNEVYSLAGQPDLQTFVIGAGVYHEKLVGRSWIESIAPPGLKHRVVRQGVFRRGGLVARGGLLFWTEPRTYPDVHQDLFMIDAEGVLRTINAYDGEYDIPPARHLGRIYWAAWERAARWSQGTVGGPVILKSAADNGTDVTVAARAPQGEAFARWGAWREGYLHDSPTGPMVLTRPGPMERQPDAGQPWTIHRLTPHGLVRLVGLPGGAQAPVVDGGSVYFILPAPQKGGAAALWLCRVRLPK